MRYAVVTFGCRVNQADSIRLEEQLIDAGGIQSAPEAADVVLVNTCSVTASADRSARQVVRRLAKSNPAVRILMTGCYATRCPDEVAELPQVFRVVGNNLKETDSRSTRVIDDGGCQRLIVSGKVTGHAVQRLSLRRSQEHFIPWGCKPAVTRPVLTALFHRRGVLEGVFYRILWSPVLHGRRSWATKRLL